MSIFNDTLYWEATYKLSMLVSDNYPAPVSLDQLDNIVDGYKEQLPTDKIAQLNAVKERIHINSLK